MTPQDWNVALRPEVPNAEAHKFIATIVRAHLEHNILLDDMVSTTTLVDTIYPAALANRVSLAKRPGIVFSMRCARNTWQAMS